MTTISSRVDTILTDLHARFDGDMLGQALVLELRDKIENTPGSLWPDAVTEAVAARVSPSVWNVESGTYKSLDKRVSHALRVWKDKYGPFTEEQECYASDLLVWAVNKAADEAGDDRRKLYSFIHQRIASLIHEERVNDGFKRRGVEFVDVRHVLAGLAS